MSNDSWSDLPTLIKWLELYPAAAKDYQWLAPWVKHIAEDLAKEVGPTLRYNPYAKESSYLALQLGHPSAQYRRWVFLSDAALTQGGKLVNLNLLGEHYQWPKDPQSCAETAVRIITELADHLGIALKGMKDYQSLLAEEIAKKRLALKYAWRKRRWYA